MHRLHTKIRDAECRRSWHAALAASEAALAKRWDAEAWACQVSCLDTLARFDELQSNLEDHVRHIERSDAEIRSFALYIAGRMHQSRGDYDLALAFYMRAAALGASLEMQALVVLQTSTINVFIEQYDEAEANLHSVLTAARKRRDLITVAHALDFLADIALRRNDLRAAGAHLAQARKDAARAGNRFRLDWLQFTSGEIECEDGDRRQGIELMIEAWRSFAECGAVGSELHACRRLGEHLLRMKRWDDAKPVVARGVELTATFRHNPACAAILRLDARLRRHSDDGFTEVDFNQVLRRADILGSHSLKSLSITHGRGRVYSEADVAELLGTLDPDLFEVLCMRVLEHEGFACERTPQAYPWLDIVAERALDKAATFRWGVSCKRVAKGLKLRDVPGSTDVRQSHCKGFIAMTSGKVSLHAAPKLRRLEEEGVVVSIWDGPRLCRFLAEHDDILAAVGYRAGGGESGYAPRRSTSRARTARTAAETCR